MKRINFLVSLTNNDNDYQQEQASAAEKTARRLGVEVKIIHANNDAVAQSQQLLHYVQDSQVVRPDAIMFEITESALLEPTPTVRENLTELHDAGFRFAIDDFGTGYSSLAHLRRLDVDMLKIDRIFINGLDEGPDDAALVRAIVNMAHSLGITVTAEGVERPRQLEILRSLGCDHAQGYLLGRPVVPGSAAGEHRPSPESATPHDATAARR